MIRPVRSAVIALVAVLAVACGETPTGTELRRDGRAAALVPGTCTTLEAMAEQAKVLYSHTSTPTVNDIKAQLAAMDYNVARGRFALAEKSASDVVAITLRKHNEGSLGGTDADVRAFVNAVLCFAGIDIDLNTPDDTYLVQPADTEQVVTNTEGTVGVEFPAGPVAEPTLITFEPIVDEFVDPCEGPLQTKLDQYPGFVRIVKTSATNAPLLQPVVVAVCPQGVIPPEVRARLRLGHGASYGFEVTPAAEADFLTCPVETGQARAGSMWDRLVDAVLPQRAHAYQSNEFGGGVGGTVTEFSPLAPVDPQLEFGGGVGGTVTEFVRVPFAKFTAPGAVASITGPCANPIEGAMGSPVRDECRPYVTIRTRLGTPFSNVPVTWSVLQGGGTIAANTGACGPFAATAATTTGLNGGAGVCWTLGAVGANQVRAVPSLGGDAVEGVTFSQSAVLFNAIANPPAGLVFSIQPPAVIPAYPPVTVQVTVVDKNGERVHASNDRVYLRPNQFTFRDGQTEANVKAVAGLATFSMVIPKPAAGYSLITSAPLSTWAIAGAVSNPFTVVPGEPFNILPQAGNNVTAPVGTVVPVRVRVVDRVGNPVPGATLNWSVAAGSPGSVTPPSAVTDANGEATASWTLGRGAQKIRAALTSGSLLVVSLSATGTAP